MLCLRRLVRRGPEGSVDRGRGRACRVVVSIANVAPYEPGSFSRRELPCVLAVLADVPGPKAVLIVDGDVDTAPGRLGLGRPLTHGPRVRRDMLRPR